MADSSKKRPARTVDPSLGIMLSFFFWMMIPLGLIVAVWIWLGEDFDRVHLLQPYPAVALVNLETPTRTAESRRRSQIAPGPLAVDTPRHSQHDPRHRLLARKRQVRTAPMTLGFAETTSDGGSSSSLSSLIADHGKIH